MITVEKLRELVTAFKSLDAKDQEKLVYIAEGMRLSQNAIHDQPKSNHDTDDTRTV